MRRVLPRKTISSVHQVNHVLYAGITGRSLGLCSTTESSATVRCLLCKTADDYVPTLGFFINRRTLAKALEQAVLLVGGNKDIHV